MARAKDLTGDRFGSLVAKEPTAARKSGSIIWRCECECGNEVLATAAKLGCGAITSCGCGANKQRRVAEANGLVDGTRLNALGYEPPCNNTSGVRGVVKDKRSGRWIAQIKFRGHHHYLGRYDTIDEAAEARHKAESELFDPVLKAHGMEPTA